MGEERRFRSHFQVVGERRRQRIHDDRRLYRARSPAQCWRSKKNGPQAIGRSRGGLTTKIHALVDALGNPVELMLTPGQDHDLTCAEPLIENADPEALIGDKAYDADPFVETLTHIGSEERPIQSASSNAARVFAGLRLIVRRRLTEPSPGPSTRRYHIMRSVVHHSKIRSRLAAMGHGETNSARTFLVCSSAVSRPSGGGADGSLECQWGTSNASERSGNWCNFIPELPAGSTDAPEFSGSGDARGGRAVQKPVDIVRWRRQPQRAGQGWGRHK